MTDQSLTKADLIAQRDELMRKRERRLNEPGYSANVLQIEQTVSALDEQIDRLEGSDTPTS